MYTAQPYSGAPGSGVSIPDPGREGYRLPAPCSELTNDVIRRATNVVKSGEEYDEGAGDQGLCLHKEKVKVRKKRYTETH